MVKEDEVKQTILQKIFEKNPITQFVEIKDSEYYTQQLVNPNDSPLTHFWKTNPFSTGAIDPANNVRDQLRTDMWQWYVFFYYW